ncbi:DUF4258 domain-containing protein [Archaeoglobus sp.]
MKIKFIEHALERMKERGITKEEVIKAISEPDYVGKGYGEREVAQKLIDGKLLRVIYERHGDEIIVITAYKTSKVEKYLR